MKLIVANGLATKIESEKFTKYKHIVRTRYLWVKMTYFISR